MLALMAIPALDKDGYFRVQLFCRYPFDPREGEPANNRSVVQRIIAGAFPLTHPPPLSPPPNLH